MSQGNQVREVSKIREIMEYIKLALKELAVNEEAINNSELDKEVENIIDAQNNGRINSLEEQTTSVNIPLEDSDKNIVKKVKVSEKDAREQAEAKRGRKKDLQKQREE